jgi:hypothetical protein
MSASHVGASDRDGNSSLHERQASYLGIRRRTRTSLRQLHRRVKLLFDENLSPRLVGAVANLLRAHALLLKAFSLDPVEALLSLQALSQKNPLSD